MTRDPKGPPATPRSRHKRPPSSVIEKHEGSRGARHLTKPDTPRASRRRPHEPRRGWLKHGNPPGDFSVAERCGAKNRRGKPCQCPAMPNGRCRLHGGLSTGPKTAQGIERIRRARWKHGWYAEARVEAARAARKRAKQLSREWQASLTPDPGRWEAFLKQRAAANTGLTKKASAPTGRPRL
jgi:hypothetical protein